MRLSFEKKKQQLFSSQRKSKTEFDTIEELVMTKQK